MCIRDRGRDDVHSRRSPPSACMRFPLTPLNARLRDTGGKIRRPPPPRRVGPAQFLFPLFTGISELIQSGARERPHKSMNDDWLTAACAESYGRFLPRFPLYSLSRHLQYQRRGKHPAAPRAAPRSADAFLTRRRLRLRSAKLPTGVYKRKRSITPWSP